LRQKTVWVSDSELRSDLESCPFACLGWKGERLHPSINQAGGRKNGARIQFEKKIGKALPGRTDTMQPLYKSVHHLLKCLVYIDLNIKVDP